MINFLEETTINQLEREVDRMELEIQKHKNEVILEIEAREQLEKLHES